MKVKRLPYQIAAGVLLLSALACNIGRPAPVPDPFEPVPATVSQGWTQAAAQTPQATSAPEQPAGACDNPYLPVVQGATWKYAMTGSVSDTFTRSILSAAADGFTDQDVFGTGVTRQGQWKCENGALIALDPTSGGSASVSTTGVTVDFQTTEQSGMTLPASPQPGDAWTQTVTLEGTETIGDTQIPAKNQFSNSCKAVGVESVTVAAGTFDALRVECQTSMTITVTMQGNDISTPVNFQATNWYVQGVGLVKTVSTGANLDSTIELTSYTVP